MSAVELARRRRTFLVFKATAAEVDDLHTAFVRVFDEQILLIDRGLAKSAADGRDGSPLASDRSERHGDVAGLSKPAGSAL